MSPSPCPGATDGAGGTPEATARSPCHPVEHIFDSPVQGLPRAGGQDLVTDPISWPLIALVGPPGLGLGVDAFCELAGVWGEVRGGTRVVAHGISATLIAGALDIAGELMRKRPANLISRAKIHDHISEIRDVRADPRANCRDRSQTLPGPGLSGAQGGGRAARCRCSGAGRLV